MRRCQQVAPADWLVDSRTPWRQLVTFGPSGFEAYARVRYLPDPEFVGQRERDVAVSADRPSHIEVARRALQLLAGFTDDADDGFFCLTEDRLEQTVHAPQERGPLLAVPHRGYALYAGSLNEIGSWDLLSTDSASPPALVWPADRRWCFASDVDPHWAGIGADRVTIAALMAATDLDVVPADPERQPPSYA